MKPDSNPSYPIIISPFSVPEPVTDCCGQKIPQRVVSVFIGILELFALLVNCIVIGITYARIPTDRRIAYSYGTPLAFPDASLGLSVAALAGGFAIIMLMFWGLQTERAALLVPHIVGQAAAGVGLLTLIAFLSIYTAVTHYEVREQAATMTLINLIVITLCVFSLILTGWFFVHSLACYRYVKVREAYRKEHTKGRVVKFDSRMDGGKVIATDIGRFEAAMMKSEAYGAI